MFRKTLEGFPEAAERLRDHLAERARETAEDISLVGAVLDPGGKRASEGEIRRV